MFVDTDGKERLIRDERFLIGLSDGGAHVDVLCDAGYATALLDIWVRQRQVLTLEQAVHKLTAVPAACCAVMSSHYLHSRFQRGNKSGGVAECF